MLQVHTCVSVHCDQCGQVLGFPAYSVHFRTENAAISAATAERWLIGVDGQWWCPACAPALICRAEGHQFTPWRLPHLNGGRPVLSEYRYCRRCCSLQSRPASQDRRDGGESR
jgi:hypothetical protein